VNVAHDVVARRCGNSRAFAFDDLSELEVLADFREEFGLNQPQRTEGGTLR
jgi:hypothetical protein